MKTNNRNVSVFAKFLISVVIGCISTALAITDLAKGNNGVGQTAILDSTGKLMTIITVFIIATFFSFFLMLVIGIHRENKPDIL